MMLIFCSCWTDAQLSGSFNFIQKTSECADVVICQMFVSACACVTVILRQPLWCQNEPKIVALIHYDNWNKNISGKSSSSLALGCLWLPCNIENVKI